MIDTPHYHIVESTLRYVAWRNNTFGLHVHVGIHGADRAIAVHRALRTVLPELLALSSTSPWLEGRYTDLHSTRTEIFTKLFPRCGIPDGFADWNRVRRVRPLPGRHAVDPRAHRDLVERASPSGLPTVETRICDGQPDFARSVALSGLMVALTADFARRYDAGEAAARLSGPRPRGEHLAGDPLGHVGRADRPRRAPLDAGGWSGSSGARPVADTAADLGIAPYLPPLREPTLVAGADEPMEDGTDPRQLWPAWSIVTSGRWGVVVGQGVER